MGCYLARRFLRRPGQGDLSADRDSEARERGRKWRGEAVRRGSGGGTNKEIRRVIAGAVRVEWWSLRAHNRHAPSLIACDFHTIHPMASVRQP